MSEEKLHVLITVPFDEELLQPLRDVSPRLELNPRLVRNYTDIVPEVWADVDVLYTSHIFPPADAMPKLKWLQCHSAGADFALSQAVIAQNPKILVSTTKGIHATNMAEYALSYILLFCRHIPAMAQAQNRKEWSEDRFEKFMPLELRKATVGIVGYGAIGRELARLVKAFGGTVLAAKRNAKQAEDHDHFTFEGTGDPHGEFFDRLYPTQALGTMVRDCDFVVITVPLTERTRGIFDERIFKKMKKGAYLINIGRGGVVDESALLEALQSGHLAGAAFDVFETEPLPPENPLWTAPNFYITPHLAGNTPDYHEKAAAVFEENLRRYLDGAPLLGQVDRKAGY